VGGLIAAVGLRLVEAVGKKVLHDFLRKLGEQVE
jgi:carbon monoxide dehydrogenase subunit G